MNLIEKNRHVVLSLVAGATALVVGCASADEGQKASEEAGGTGASTAGGSSGTGTNGGSAGVGNGTGGRNPWAGGGAGGSAGRDCTADITEVAPSDGVIATFAGEDGIVHELGAFPPDGPGAAIFSTEDGALHITLNVEATSTWQVPAVILGFGTIERGACMDASAFSGVEFSISGSLAGCTMEYATGDPAHQDANSGAPVATGATGSFQPLTTITAAQLTAEPQILTMPFVSDRTVGRPASPVDPAKLIFLLWQFSINEADGAETPPCVADITIDDVKFY